MFIGPQIDIDAIKAKNISSMAHHTFVKCFCYKLHLVIEKYHLNNKESLMPFLSTAVF